MKNQNTIEQIDRYIDEHEGDELIVIFGNIGIAGNIERNKYGYWFIDEDGEQTKLHIGGLTLRNGKLVYDYQAGLKEANAVRKEMPFI